MMKTNKELLAELEDRLSHYDLSEEEFILEGLIAKIIEEEDEYPYFLHEARIHIEFMSEIIARMKRLYINNSEDTQDES